MLLLTRQNVPIEKRFTFDAMVLPWDPEKVQGNVGIPRTYVAKNDKKSGFGEFCLWNGKARIFQDDGHNSTIFFSEKDVVLSFTPVGDKFSLYTGDSRDIVITQRKMKDIKINVKKNNSGSIVLYDTDEIMKIEIENFKDAPANLTIENILGQGIWKKHLISMKKKMPTS